MAPILSPGLVRRKPAPSIAIPNASQLLTPRKTSSSRSRNKDHLLTPTTSPNPGNILVPAGDAARGRRGILKPSPKSRFKLNNFISAAIPFNIHPPSSDLDVPKDVEMNSRTPSRMSRRSTRTSATLIDENHNPHDDYPPEPPPKSPSFHARHQRNHSHDTTTTYDPDRFNELYLFARNENKVKSVDDILSNIPRSRNINEGPSLDCAAFFLATVPGHELSLRTLWRYVQTCRPMLSEDLLRAHLNNSPCFEGKVYKTRVLVPIDEDNVREVLVDELRFAYYPGLDEKSPRRVLIYQWIRSQMQLLWYNEIAERIRTAF